MRISTYALASALAALTLAAPATAQRVEQSKNTQTSIRGQSGGAASKSEEKAEEQQSADKLSTGRKLDISKKARPAIIELQNAVIANDTANIPAKLAAAQAVAQSADDKYAIAINQIKAATNANDLAGMKAGIDALKASSGAEPADLASRYNNLGKRYYDAKQLDPAVAAFESTLAVDANNSDALKMLASVRNDQGRPADAASLMGKSLAAMKAAGHKPSENDYKFAAKVAFASKSPASDDITRGLLTDYPTQGNWRTVLGIYRDANRLQGDSKVDVLRLASAANALQGDGDYFAYVNELVMLGYLNEAKTVVDQASAAKAIDPNKQVFKQFAAKLATAPSRATIDSVAKTALAGPPQKAMDAGNALYGVGAYAEAAPYYKAVAAKGGAAANEANLRLGMALARSGDKVGAAAALNAVTGSQAGIAKFWLIWLNSQG
ncbi:tetratricopeptide repeat protein [Sphingomonas alba]|uniref:Tetratricopeptide repeat protein n=1 Tax=Sphingomonas alba TaxID=2908208 RepID=A0ABT0RIR0_9SPHN|nr:tetratricopeptide repeat protein [Sphingomonas alba]MCL6682511.1 tetratricopeptide repeat protein [Sphingomonas alba]